MEDAAAAVALEGSVCSRSSCPLALSQSPQPPRGRPLAAMSHHSSVSLRPASHQSDVHQHTLTQTHNTHLHPREMCPTTSGCINQHTAQLLCCRSSNKQNKIWLKLETCCSQCRYIRCVASILNINSVQPLKNAKMSICVFSDTMLTFV